MLACPGAKGTPNLALSLISVSSDEELPIPVALSLLDREIDEHNIHLGIKEPLGA